MVISDDEYIAASDDDDDVGKDKDLAGNPSSGSRARATRTNNDSSGFEVSRTWENLTESADGTITGAVQGLLQAGKRQRLVGI